MAAKTKKKKMRQGRYDELRQILKDRRLEIIGEVKHKMRDVRTEGAVETGQGVRGQVESSEAEIQDDIEFALLQIKAETLSKITEALSLLEAETYGYCYECGEEMAQRRLRALPFAIRCTGCEAERETAQDLARLAAGRRGTESLFADMIG